MPDWSALQEFPDIRSNNSDEDGASMSPMDVSNMNYPGNITTKPFSEIVVKTVMYIPVIAMAIVGNILVILVVARNKRMRTTTNYYIVNLAVADCLVALSCTWVHLLDDLTPGWVLGAFFCKFDTFAQGKKMRLVFELRSCFYVGECACVFCIS